MVTLQFQFKVPWSKEINLMKSFCKKDLITDKFKFVKVKQFGYTKTASGKLSHDFLRFRIRGAL